MKWKLLAFYRELDMHCNPEGPSVQRLVLGRLGTGSCRRSLSGIDDYWVRGPLGLVLEA